MEIRVTRSRKPALSHLATFKARSPALERENDSRWLTPTRRDLGAILSQEQEKNGATHLVKSEEYRLSWHSRPPSSLSDQAVLAVVV